MNAACHREEAQVVVDHLTRLLSENAHAARVGVPFPSDRRRSLGKVAFFDGLNSPHNPLKRSIS